MKIKPYLLFKFLNIIGFLLITICVSAQVKTKIFKDSIPPEIKPNKVAINKVIQFDPPNSFEQLRNEQNKNIDNGIEPKNQFAVSLFTNIDFIRTSERLDENGYTQFTLTIIAKQALNVSLEFSDFELSANSLLSIFTKRELTDSITNSQNNQNKVWATRVYQGDILYVVLTLPTPEIKETSIRVSKINFGFKNFGAEYGNVGASENCNINVACTQGNGWENERNSVSLIVANGQESCSGALVMNTCNTNVPYLLTANHCLDAGNVTNWVFQFQYWSATCTPNSGWNEDVQFNGCVLRANNAASDFALLQLNQTPASNSNIRYAGWSRQTTGINSTTIIHHPAGDLMKISVDNNAPTTTTTVGIDCWQLGLDIGATEGGSSGSPFFDQNHRIIAQHFGTGQSGLPICQRTEKYGGRFDLSWTGGATNSTRLSNWLDPGGSGAMTTNTTNVSDLINLGGLTISGDDEFCTGNRQYTLNGVPAGTTVSWQSSNTNIATISSTGNPATLTKVANGYVTITATITGCSGLPSPTKVVSIGSPVTITTTNNGCNGQYQIWTLSAIPSNHGSNWYWYVSYLGNNSQITIYNPSSSSTQISVKGGGVVSVSYTDACGVSQVNGVTVYSSCYSYRLSVSPNPVKTLLNVTIDNEAEDIKALNKTENIKMELYQSGSGVLQKQWSFKNTRNQFTLDVHGLKPGIYMLKVMKGAYSQTQMIMIE